MKSGVNSAKSVLQFIFKLWSEEGAEEYAVPMTMAVSKKMGQNISENDAIQQVVTASQQMERPIKPNQKPTQTAAAPQPTAQPMKQAASDISSVVQDLPNNYMKIWNMKDKFADPMAKQLLQVYFDKLIKQIQGMAAQQQEIPDNLLAALKVVGQVLKGKPI